FGDAEVQFPATYAGNVLGRDEVHLTFAQPVLGEFPLGDVLPGPQDAGDVSGGVVQGEFVCFQPDGSAVGERRGLDDAQLRHVRLHDLAIFEDEVVRLLAGQAGEVVVVQADDLLWAVEAEGATNDAIAPQVVRPAILPEHPLRDVV